MALHGKANNNGSAISAGDLRVFIYDAASGGNLVYDSLSDFNGTISSGIFDVMLGSGAVELDLNYGTYYYLDMQINSTGSAPVDLDFNGTERKQFEASRGKIRSGGIVDGTIVNADISSNAAIGWTKISTTGSDLNNFNWGSDFNAQYPRKASGAPDQNILNTWNFNGQTTWGSGYGSGGTTIQNGVVYTQTLVLTTDLNFVTVNTVDINGHSTPSINNTWDFGSTSLRWRAIYSQDLNAVTSSIGTLTLANPLGLSYGGTGSTSFSSGRIPFSNGTILTSDGNLFWNNTDKRLGIGTSSPANLLNVAGDINATGNVYGAQLCIGSDCRSSWPSGSGGDVNWSALNAALPWADVNVANNLTIVTTSDANFDANVAFGGVEFNFPRTYGSSGQVLHTDGLGNLSWNTDDTSAGGNDTNTVTAGWTNNEGEFTIDLNGLTAINTNTLRSLDNNALSIQTQNTARITITADGNIGIGTTNPVRKLQVLGATDVNTFAVDAVNNRVGINKGSPTVELDVNGAITASGNITSSGSVNANTSAGFGAGGSGTTSTAFAARGSTLSATKGGWSTGNLPGTANQSFVYMGVNPVFGEATSGTHPLIAGVGFFPGTISDAAGATTNVATLYIAGSSTFAQSTYVPYALWVDKNTTTPEGNKVRFDSNVMINSDVNHAIGVFDINAPNGPNGAAGTRVVVGFDGNLGVNTTTPNRNLHVVGDANITGKLILSAGAQLCSVTDANCFYPNTGGGTGGSGTGDVTWSTLNSIIPWVDANITDALTINTGQGAHFNADLNAIAGLSTNTLRSLDSNNLSIQTSNTTRMTILGADGNIGIGTTSPAGKLHILGATDVNTFVVNTFTNRIGINKATPTVELDINGSAAITGTFTGGTFSGVLNGSNVSTAVVQLKGASTTVQYSVRSTSNLAAPNPGVAGAGFLSQTVAVTTSSTFNPIFTNILALPLEVTKGSGDVNYVPTVYIGGSSGFGQATTSTAAIPNPRVYALWVDDANFNANGQNIVKIDGNLAIGFADDLNRTSNWFDVNTIGGRFVVAGDGNVGINSATPNRKLQVVGDANITGKLILSAGAQLCSVTDANCFYPNTGGGTGGSGTGDVTWSTLNSIIPWVDANVANDLTIASTNNGVFTQDLNTNKINSNTLASKDNNALSLQTNNSTRLTIGTDGNIGINNTSPTGLLDVNTTINNGPYHALFVNKQSGFVGIGKVDPTTALDVNGVLTVLGGSTSTAAIVANNGLISFGVGGTIGGGGSGTTASGNLRGSTGNAIATKLMVGGGTLPNFANTPGVVLLVNPIINETSSGTHQLLAGAAFKVPAITNGNAATTDVATVYIEGSSTFAQSTYVPYALWVDKNTTTSFGNKVRFDSNIFINSDLNQAIGVFDINAPNGPNGAAGTRVVVGFDGNLGVNTTTPNRNLHVVGDANITGKLILSAGAQLCSVTDANCFYPNAGGSGSGSSQWTTNGSNIHFPSSAGATGNVGINVVSPTQRLDVNGDVNISSATPTITFGGASLSKNSNGDVILTD